ncbi:MAG: LPS biosynthesis protein WbpP [Isosphaera sp.]|nr:LPS biosynthesis protein WbpP [Isosphaera sp.]
MKLPGELVARWTPDYQGRSVCVTGAAGFIGGHLLDALISLGATVCAIDDLSNSAADHVASLIELDPARVRFLHASVLDPGALDESVRGCSLVFHLAALGSVPRSMVMPERAMIVNAHGTVAVLQAARRAGVPRVVLASSSSVYGDTGVQTHGPAAPGPPVAKSESMAPAPRSPYAASKLAAEAAMQAWHHSFGLQTLSLRLFNVFGPRQPPAGSYAAVIPAFARAVWRGSRPVVYGDGSQSRDFTPVAAAVAAFLQSGSTRRPLTGQALNIGTGERCPVSQLAQMIAHAAGRPDLMPEFQPPRAGDVQHSLADISAARALIDYAPVATLRSALPETVLSYRDGGVDVTEFAQ